MFKKHYPSAIKCYILARRTMRFYRTSFNQTKTPNIPYTFLRHEHHLMTYLWDIYEEIKMYEVIQEPTDKLQKLYDDLQGMLDYAI